MNISGPFQRIVLATFFVTGCPTSAYAAETQEYKYDVHGRLVEVGVTGGPATLQKRVICYDIADNRTYYRTTNNGTTPTCSASTPPPPTNLPPLANPDTYSAPKCVVRQVNVVANDTDPEGNYPLVLLSTSESWASVYNSTTIVVITPETNGQYLVNYTVRDSLGATSTGTLTLNVTGKQQCM